MEYLKWPVLDFNSTYGYGNAEKEEVLEKLGLEVKTGLITVHA